MINRVAPIVLTVCTCLLFAISAGAQGDLDRLLPMHRDTAILAHAYSPDGKWFVAAGHDVVVYRTSDHGFSHRLADLPGIVTAVAFSGDSTKLAVEVARDDLAPRHPKSDSAQYAFDLLVFDVDTGKQLHRFRGQDGASLLGRGIALSPTGDKLATHSDGYDVIVYDLDTGKPTWRWRAATEEPVSASYAPFAVTPDWKYFLVTTQRVAYPSKDTTDPVAMRSDYRETVRSQYIKADGKLALAQADDTILLFEPVTGKTVKQHEVNQVRNFGASNDLSMYVSNGSMWRPGAAEPVKTAGWVEAVNPAPITFSPDGREVTMGTHYADPMLIGDFGKGRKRPWNPTAAVNLRFADFGKPDDLNVIVNGWSHFHTIDPADGTMTPPQPDPGNQVVVQRYGSSARCEIWAGGQWIETYDGWGTFWTLKPKTTEAAKLMDGKHAEPYDRDVLPLVIGKEVVLIAEREDTGDLHALRFDRTNNHAFLGDAPLPKDLRLTDIKGVRASQNFKYLAIASRPRGDEVEPAGHVTVVEHATGKVLLGSTQGWVARSLTVRDESDVLDVSNDGKLLVWAKSKTVELISLPDGKLIHALRVERGVPVRVRLKPDGKTLWVINSEDLITQFDVERGEVTGYFQFVRAKDPSRGVGHEVSELIAFDASGELINAGRAAEAAVLQASP